MAFRGRHWIAFWLVALLAALWAVIARQTASLNAARALTDLRPLAQAVPRHRYAVRRLPMRQPLGFPPIPKSS